MTIHVFDHGLGDWTGHWINFNRALSQEAEKRNRRCIHYGNNNIDRHIVGNDLTIIPTFQYHPWDSPRGEPVEDEKILYQLFLEDLKRIDVEGFNATDLLLFVTVTQNELRAILQWASELSDNFPKLAVLFQFGEGVSSYVPGSSLSPVANIYYNAFQKSALNWKNKIRFFASSNQLANTFADLLSIEISTLCMPTCLIGSGLDTPVHKANNTIYQSSCKMPSISYVGHSALEKGAQFLHEIAVRTIEKYPAVIFKYHINPNKYCENVLKVFDYPISGIQCYKGHLETGHYYDLISNSEILLLPYDPLKYKYTPSAVFSEALSYGRVLVLPANTWLSKAAQDMETGFVSFPEYSADSIVIALHQALDDLNVLSTKANIAAKKWRDTNNVNRFFDSLIQAMN